MCSHDMSAQLNCVGLHERDGLYHQGCTCTYDDLDMIGIAYKLVAADTSVRENGTLPVFMLKAPRKASEATFRPGMPAIVRIPSEAS